MKAVPGFILIAIFCLIVTVGAPIFVPAMLVVAGLYWVFTVIKGKPPSPPSSSP